MSKIELDKCEELGILKYKSKSKSQLLELINAAKIRRRNTRRFTKC
jgi:hypothetical protein